MIIVRKDKKNVRIFSLKLNSKYHKCSNGVY